MRKPAVTDLEHGEIGKANWPDCKLNPHMAQVHCKCKDFDIRLRRDGAADIVCIQAKPTD